MAIKFSNNASGTLAASITAAATSITLTTGQGALFPAMSAGDYFFATLVDSSNNLEIVRVNARSSDTLTVVRGQDGTTARTYAAGDKVELRVTAAALTAVAAGENLSRTYAISISGNAATATSATSATTADSATTATSATNATNATNAANLDTANWIFTQSGTELVASYDGTRRFKITSTGDLVVSGNVTAYGTV